MRTVSRLAGALAAALFAATALAGCGAAAASAPPVLSGDVFVHDPAYVQTPEGDYVYSTGNGQIGDGNIQIRRSDDGASWEYLGEVWASKPAWLVEAVPGVDNLWAPELYEHDGTWYLYYSASTFGSSDSVIALATNSTLDPADPSYEWVDRGEVISSADADFNAIDPGIVEDADGVPWMAFGSFFSGIHMVELEWPSGLRASGAAEPVRIADRGLVENAIEAPSIVPRDGWYYLFLSRNFCCKGVDSTYEIIVGRSKSVTGPYLDADGGELLDDGGTVVLTTGGSLIGPGGQSVSGDTLAFHFYDAAADGIPTLGLRPLTWRDGWPEVAD
ncbi:arabinan endo-1,5-alpha-L-arabinosidase [Microbacterium aurantiacum]|uniref:arabinan endo-1,5-alpha-L-arabinosidase n=1 Tax=Microbacterium aurantiacum TaxID=162393 RepID=UPI000C7FF7AE|nr:arabinan endo-1,5-alpha-L-arabinosidase [Microbacterium aurantiacum]